MKKDRYKRVSMTSFIKPRGGASSIVRSILDSGWYVVYVSLRTSNFVCGTFEHVRVYIIHFTAEDLNRKVFKVFSVCSIKWINERF